MRGVTDEHHTGAHLLTGSDQPQGKCVARADTDKAAQPVTETLLQLREKCRIVEPLMMQRLLRWQGPDQRRPLPLFRIPQRQKCQWPLISKTLKGDAAVGPSELHLGNQGSLSIILGLGFDAESVTQGGITDRKSGV